MSDVQTARWGKLLQAAFNLKQRLTLGQALPDVFPTYSLENRSPEMEVQAGMDLGRIYVSMAAMAANYSNIWLVNPARSGKVIIVDEINVSSSVAAGVYIAMGGAGSAATTVPSFCDWRRAQQGRPTAVCQQLHAAASLAAVAMDARSLLAGANLSIAGPIVLTESASLWVQNSTLNASLLCSFRFRERVLDQGETLL